jgi:hypothetical protein
MVEDECPKIDTPVTVRLSNAVGSIGSSGIDWITIICVIIAIILAYMLVRRNG